MSHPVEVGITGSGPGAFAAVDVHYPRSGGARAAAVVAGDAVFSVLRGRSARPLFITAAGMAPAEAARLVRRMAGPFRLPDALRRADALSRTGTAGGQAPGHHDWIYPG